MADDKEFSICRLCLSGNGNLAFIFQSDVISGCVPADVISDLMQFQVSENDAYPQFACLECMGKLKDFKVFKEMCITSKELLDRAYTANCESIKGAYSEEIYKQNGICEDEETLRTLEVIAANATLLELKKESEECPVKDESDSDDNLSCISEWEEVPIDPVSVPLKEEKSIDGDSANESADDPNNDESDDDRKSNIPEWEGVSANHSPDSLEEKQSIADVSSELTNSHCSNLKIETDGEIPENVPQDPINDSILRDYLLQRQQMCDTFQYNGCEPSFASREEITTQKSTHVDNRPKRLVKKRSNSDIKSKGYKKLNSRLKRQKMEEVPKVYWCDICGKILSCEQSLGIHKIAHEREVVRCFGCNECYRMLASLPQLSIHVRSHRGALPFPCPVCNVRFSVKCDLHNHFNTLHIDSKEATYNCADCGYLNADIQGVEISMKESGDAEITGEDFSFFDDPPGEKVIGKNKSSKRIKCPDCGREFKKLSHLKRHSLVHMESPKLTLNLPSFEDPPEEELSGEKEDSERIKCQECGREFKKLSYLKRHSVLHSDTPKFECLECGKKYHLKWTLEQHIKCHSIVRVKCPICDQECKNEMSLKNHLKYHTEKNLKCRMCSKAFRYQSKLTIHMKSHNQL